MTRVRVGVTGLGVVSPVGIGWRAYWEALLAGRSGIKPITSFDASGHTVRIAGEITDFAGDDWVTAKELRRLDRFCHLALAAAEMAVTDAGFNPADRTRVGTVFSSAIGGAATIERGCRQHENGGQAVVSPMFIPASIVNMAAGQIALRFGFGGPNTCPVTACASSADAVGSGFRLVRDGYADACLVGGSEACIRGPVIAGFANIGALSQRNDDPASASRPFDSARDGFVLAEGSAALMLEPIDAAERRGAPVYAELCGYGQTCDAYHSTAPDPMGGGASRAIRAALADAGAEPETVGYVNAHGTSTRLLDPIETRAIRLALGPASEKLAVSSTKSMTGHMLGAAGAVEAIACTLALHTSTVPPTINLDTPDRECDLDYVPNRARHLLPDVALSNSMGFGGHNACLAFRAVD